MAASAKVYKGANKIQDGSLIGRTISSILNDDTIVDALNLSGDETVRVNGETVDKSYTIRSNDAVEFYKQQGTKGLLAAWFRFVEIRWLKQKEPLSLR